MDRSLYPRFLDGQDRGATPQPACQRGDSVHKIDEVLAELLGVYRAKFPELRLAVVETPAASW